MSYHKNTAFLRILLKNVMKDVREFCRSKNIPFKEFIKHSWGYKYSGMGTVEFHINKNPWLPEGFYWYGHGSSITEAKAEGWSAFLNEYHYDFAGKELKGLLR